MRVGFQQILRELAARRRLLLLGGMAIILHGQSRSTDDADVWVDPHPLDDWAAALRQVLADHPALRWERLTANGWQEPGEATLETAAHAEGVIRVTGCDRPIDVFYRPNEVGPDEFEGMWERARATVDGIRFLEEIDLLLTKQATGRSKDYPDIVFLEGKVDAAYRERLLVAGLEEATKLLERYATPGLLREVVQSAADEEVRALARRMLAGLYDDGDPFAAEYLRELAG